ncbi:MAG: sugar phosphate isomerase/epimerase [Planctomycetaceae bacterium]|nr:sugar phosphate isomerase/epimerase [Planctomycetaceae bacterium]
MNIGVFSPLFNHCSLGQMLDAITNAGLDAVEIGCGYFPGNAHCDYETLLSSDAALAAYKDEFARRNIAISALSAHGNPLHPDPAIAGPSQERWRAAVELAPKLGVDVVNAFSGCPGDQENARYSNWATTSWPPDFQHILAWQWQEKVIPYWKREVAVAAEKGIHKIAIEMHPGMVVYNNATLFKLREAVGTAIGVNFDPSHLFWQQADIMEAIRHLCGENAIYHFHAKDTAFNEDNLRKNGVLETLPSEKISDRAWNFRSVGYGHDAIYWKRIISELWRGGYRGTISIEHEDLFMSMEEGLAKAVAFLKECIIRSDAGIVFE